MTRLQVEGLDVSLRREGGGPPLVLLHPAFLSKEVWERCIPLLAPRYDIIAPDLPGHGDTPAPDAWNPDMVGFLGRFAEALNLPAADWVGSSFSGGLLIRLAAAQPGRIRRMALSAPTGIPKAEMDAVRERQPKARSTWDAFRESFEDPALATRERYHEFSRLQKVAAPFFRRYRATHPPDYDRVGWVPQMRMVLAPTLLIWGDRDAVIPPPMDERTRREIPSARLVVLRGARHFPYLDRPREFCDRVVEFLEGDLGGE